MIPAGFNATLYTFQLIPPLTLRRPFPRTLSGGVEEPFPVPTRNSENPTVLEVPSVTSLILRPTVSANMPLLSVCVL